MIIALNGYFTYIFKCIQCKYKSALLNNNKNNKSTKCGCFARARYFRSTILT